MKTERPMDPADADAARDWLEGLAGRPGASAAHGEGARLRAALAPDAQDAPAATWRDIEARAGDWTAADAGGAPAVLSTQAGLPMPSQAANDARPWRKLGWAAALMLGVGLLTLILQPEPTPDPALRGVGGQVPPGSLQAEVTVTREGEAAILTIRALPGAVDAVNARLANLETGLDAEGKLQLAVRPMR
jgi:hypothetical protein